MSYNPPNANGQGTMANSSPVTIASNQSGFPAITSVAFSLTNTTGSSSIALAGYQGAGFNVSSNTWNAVLKAEISMDNGSTWFFATVITRGSGATGNTIDNALANATGNYEIVIPGGATHVRMRASSYTSGTITGTLIATTGFSAYTPADLATLNGSTIATNSGNKSAGTQRVVLATDQPALSTPLPMAASAAATGGYSFSNMTTNTTTTIKSGAGTLHSVIINTRGVGTNAVIYDNTSGTSNPIATIDTTLSTTAFLYDVAFSTGLRVTTAGTTPADLTFTYK